MLEAFEKLGYKMSIKIHFLQSHDNDMPSNLDAFSEGHSNRFHLDIKILEDRNQARWDI